MTERDKLFKFIQRNEGNEAEIKILVRRDSLAEHFSEVGIMKLPQKTADLLRNGLWNSGILFQWETWIQETP